MNNRYTNLALNALIASIIFFLVFIGVSFSQSYTSTIENISIIASIGFVVSNICGFVFTLLSYLKKEKESTLKTLVTVGNVFIFLIVLGLLSFIFMDLLSAGNYQ